MSSPPSDDVNSASTAIRTRNTADFPTTRLKPEATLRWRDAAGDHELVIDRAITVGSSNKVGLVLADRAVSRLHLEIEPREDGVWVRDLGSTNGTFVARIQIVHACVQDGTRLQVGDTEIEVRQSPAAKSTDLSPRTSFGPLLGRSVVMRDLFMKLSPISLSNGTVLVHGETGTGKEVVARAIHANSTRARESFVIVDCSALTESLLEAELFGSKRGSFTGSVADRAGAFRDADGGTLFLDEIGEMPLSLQPKLLRALESRQVRRIGESHHETVDVRFVAATNRDLREMVNKGSFREDLYFRLAVLPVEVPPLRDRLDDVPMLLEAMLPPQLFGMVNAERARRLAALRWPGNVRELRNFAERLTALGWDAALDACEPKSPASNTERAPVMPSIAHEVTAGEGDLGSLPAALLSGAHGIARERVNEWWERSYLRALMARHGGDAKAAAREAAIDPSYLWKRMKYRGF